MTINVREYRKNFNFGNLPDKAVLEFYKLFNERMNIKDHNQIISELKTKYKTRQPHASDLEDIASRPSFAKSNWQEILKKPNKGKRFVSKEGTSYGQAGKAKDGKDRIQPNSKKGDAYCARSNNIKGDWRSDPDSPNNLSRKKWKCHGNKSSK